MAPDLVLETPAGKSRANSPLFSPAKKSHRATMPSMPAQIEFYEQMSMLSSRMVEAARRNDWERLIDLEQSVAGLREVLLRDDGHHVVPTDSSRKRDLIQRILRDDAEVRRHTEPWMEQVRHLLTGNFHESSVSRRYGSGR